MHSPLHPPCSPCAARARSRRLAPFALLAPLVGLLAGCGDALAKANPCGGIYADQGVAAISDVHVAGTMDATGSHAFDSTSDTLGSAGPCTTFSSGLAPGSTTLWVSCPGATVMVTLPDVRALAAGAVVSVPVDLKPEGDMSPLGDPCVKGTGTLTIDRAAGGSQGAAPYVTGDFLRAGRLELAIDADAGAADGGRSACPPRASLRADVELAATNYKQAMTSGANDCGDLQRFHR